ncbi:hypothetical protein [Calidithermus timidus]|jgi:hypothetical protein|uniref:hypothetical protein n=1 Tax=Calidithermus timidus TaxID=307124 RepID=UPI000371580C|nr:hypothetical protein [Calidithermus timidus]
MRLVFIFFILLLAACGSPGIPTGSVIRVDGAEVITPALGENEAAFFNLEVGGAAVRLDAFALDNPKAAQLEVTVFDSNRLPYARSVSRSWFVAPGLALSPAQRNPKLIDPNLPFSLNLPANFGKAYVRVRNRLNEPTRVRVRAVVRAGYKGSSGLEIVGSTQGALLFLGQLDSYVYRGKKARLTLSYPGGSLRPLVEVVRGGSRVFRGEPGVSFDLEPGDQIFVREQSNGGLAGFCDQALGCTDGVNSGIYTLWIE